tara:strand:- start:451 stop:924 length:474 start_codon:yes stop_codon:yes gene_type:complete
MVKAIKKEKKKKKKNIKKPRKKQKRTRHSLIQRRTLNVPEIQNLVTDNERGGRSQNTDNMTADQLLKYYSNILEGYSPIGNNAQTNFAPVPEAVKLALDRRHDNPETKPESKKMVTPSVGSFKRRLSLGGRRKSKRRRKKKRRRTIKKKRKKRKKKH